MSAKYGILHFEDKIIYYEKTLNNITYKQIKEWNLKVDNQSTVLGISKKDTIIFLCRKNYYKYLKKIFTNNKIPFENQPLGKRLSLLKKELNKQ